MSLLGIWNLSFIPICCSCCETTANSVVNAGGVGGRFFMFLARCFRFSVTCDTDFPPSINDTVSDSSPSSSSVEIGL